MVAITPAMLRVIKTSEAESEALFVFADIKKFSYFVIKKQIIGFDLDPHNGQELFDVTKVSSSERPTRTLPPRAPRR
jgi:hypothetical protein